MGGLAVGRITARFRLVGGKTYSVWKGRYFYTQLAYTPYVDAMIRDEASLRLELNFTLTTSIPPGICTNVDTCGFGMDKLRYIVRKLIFSNKVHGSLEYEIQRY